MRNCPRSPFIDMCMILTLDLCTVWAQIAYSCISVTTAGQSSINGSLGIRFPGSWTSNSLVLDKLLKLGQGELHDYATPLWCGHPKSHLYFSGIRHSQWSCPSPTKVRFPIYYFTWAWVGCQVEKDFQW